MPKLIWKIDYTKSSTLKFGSPKIKLRGIIDNDMSCWNKVELHVLMLKVPLICHLFLFISLKNMHKHGFLVCLNHHPKDSNQGGIHYQCSL